MFSPSPGARLDHRQPLDRDASGGCAARNDRAEGHAVNERGCAHRPNEGVDVLDLTLDGVSEGPR
jgi:hypothetical protein